MLGAIVDWARAVMKIAFDLFASLIGTADPWRPKGGGGGGLGGKLVPPAVGGVLGEDEDGDEVMTVDDELGP
jgi:hypothetical protein